MSSFEQGAAELKRVLDTSVTSRDERLSKEALLESIFPGISNEVIARFSEQKYVFGELEKRVFEGGEFGLSILFELAQPLSGVSFNTKSEKRLAVLRTKGIENSAGAAPFEEVVKLIVDHAQTQLDANTSFLDMVLSWREDIDEVVVGVSGYERVSESGISQSYLEGLKARAIMMREARE